MKIIFFDVETTGLPISWKEKFTNKSNWPYIVQLAYIISYEDNEISEEQDYILKPEGFKIPEKSTSIHGISNELAIKKGNSRKEILFLFAAQIRSCDYIIAHNTDFDINVLRCEFLRNNIEDPFNEDVKIICTMRQSKNFCKLPSAYGDYKWPSLQELYSKLFGEYFNESHNAKVDVKATFECFWKLHQLNIIKIKQNEKNQEPILDRNFWLSFFKERKNLFFELISLYYPLDEDLLVLFENKLHWENVSRNTAINWNIEIIEKFQDKWGFQVSYMGWPNGPIKWYGLSSNPNLPWSIELITAYKENLAFYDHSDYNAGTVSTNSALPWSDDLLEEFKDEWNWDELSSSSFLPWHKISINKFKNYWNPKFLSKNLSLPWSIYFIAKYQDCWDWPTINEMIVDKKIDISVKEVMKAYFEDEINVQNMVYLPLNEQFLDLAIDSWEFNWDCLGGYGILPWSAELIKKYLHKMGLYTYIYNDSIKWNIDLLHQLDDIFLWSHFSYNEKFDWNEDFFIEFEHKINFDETKHESYKMNWLCLKKNKAIVWSEFLLGRYYNFLKDDKEFWKELSWNNLNANWTPKIIENYRDHWDWIGLSQNTSVCFSDSLIREYEKYWEWDFLSRNDSVEWRLSTLEFYIKRFKNNDFDFCCDADSFRFVGPSHIIKNLSEKLPNKKPTNSFFDNLKILMSLNDDDDWASTEYDIWQLIKVKDEVWEKSKDEIDIDFIKQINAIINENSR